MVHYLHGRVSDRKLRLFGCACCRGVWDLLTEECFRIAIEVAERFVDNRASKKELADAKKVSGAALAQSGLRGVTGRPYCALGAAWSSTRTPVGSAAEYPLWVLTSEADRERHVSLLRDLFGNPFRPPPAIEPAWLTWNNGTVVRLAAAAYEERALPSGELDVGRLAVLADALEEAGCTDADLLGHLRGPGPHVRGCWSVDLLLGKE
jgi:hypothetical protein